MIQRTRGSMLLTACNLSQVIWMQFTNSQYVAIQRPDMIQSRFYLIKLQTIFFFFSRSWNKMVWLINAPLGSFWWKYICCGKHNVSSFVICCPVFNEVLCLIHPSRLTLTPAQFSDCRSLCHPAAAHCIFSVFLTTWKQRQLWPVQHHPSTQNGSSCII